MTKASAVKKNTLDLKKILAKLLVDIGIIKADGFTGQIIINLNQGGITMIQRAETIR